MEFKICESIMFDIRKVGGGGGGGGGGGYSLCEGDE